MYDTTMTEFMSRSAISSYHIEGSIVAALP